MTARGSHRLLSSPPTTRRAVWAKSSVPCARAAPTPSSSSTMRAATARGGRRWPPAPRCCPWRSTSGPGAQRRPACATRFATATAWWSPWTRTASTIRLYRRPAGADRGRGGGSGHRGLRRALLAPAAPGLATAGRHLGAALRGPDQRLPGLWTACAAGAVQLAGNLSRLPGRWGAVAAAGKRLFYRGPRGSNGAEAHGHSRVFSSWLVVAHYMCHTLLLGTAKRSISHRSRRGAPGPCDGAAGSCDIAG